MISYSTFRVIKIIDEYSLVINGGLSDDISLGDEIEIYLEGDVITDPFNEYEELGTLDYVKEKLEVTEVYSKFSVCKKFKQEKIYQPSSLQKALSSAALNLSSISSISSLAGSTETKITVEKINVDQTKMSGRKTGDNIIGIGDLARLGLKE